MTTTSVKITALRIIIKLLHKVHAFMRKLCDSVEDSRYNCRDTLVTSVETLVADERKKYHEVCNESFDTRAAINKEHDALVEYFRTESSRLMAELNNVDNPDAVADRSARIKEIYKRMAELRQLAEV